MNLVLYLIHRFSVICVHVFEGCILVQEDQFYRADWAIALFPDDNLSFIFFMLFDLSVPRRTIDE